jgi:hypothetical protein
MCCSRRSLCWIVLSTRSTTRLGKRYRKCGKSTGRCNSGYESIAQADPPPEAGCGCCCACSPEVLEDLLLGHRPLQNGGNDLELPGAAILGPSGASVRIRRPLRGDEFTAADVADGSVVPVQGPRKLLTGHRAWGEMSDGQVAKRTSRSPGKALDGRFRRKLSLGVLMLTDCK